MVNRVQTPQMRLWVHSGQPPCTSNSSSVDVTEDPGFPPVLSGDWLCQRWSLPLYWGSRPWLISNHDHGRVTSFGHKLVETSCPIPACQIVIPSQVLGFHFMQAGRMCRKNLGRPQGTCCGERFECIKGAALGTPVFWVLARVRPPAC